jgi:hypothetical protein
MPPIHIKNNFYCQNLKLRRQKSYGDCTEFHLIKVDLRFQSSHLDLGFSARGSLPPLAGDRQQQVCPPVLTQRLTHVYPSFAAGNKWLDVPNLGLPLIWAGKSQANI